jgi:2-polyprenyl-3-methyl-5-hydroxy-6-metoxy-1,4-benzoquinol methylase
VTWEDRREANRRRWDDMAPVHAGPGRSGFYSVDEFVAGQSKLRDFMLGELPPLAGKSLLHLQCQFGLETLSYARLGARVTGLDFSQAALDAAAETARRAGLEARWVCADVYAAREALGGERFDVVVSGGGAVNWLPDVARWARVVADCLEPGGTCYFEELHPFAATFDAERDDGLLVAEHAYFGGDGVEPQRLEAASGTYAVAGAPLAHTVTYEWNHPIGEVVTALIAAGLRLEFLHEFAYGTYRQFPQMVPDARRSEPGLPYWVLRDRPERVPLVYSLCAVKD